LTLISLLILSAFLSGCASLRPDFDPPKVTVESVKSIPSEDIGPRFEIKLRVVNPNNQILDVAGISYTIDFLDRELVSGVTSEIPVIEAYSEEVVTLEAGINMFQILRVLTGIGKSTLEEFEYRFTAKIDFNGFIPTQRVEEVGVLSLK